MLRTSQSLGKNSVNLPVMTHATIEDITSKNKGNYTPDQINDRIKRAIERPLKSFMKQFTSSFGWIKKRGQFLYTLTTNSRKYT